MPSILRAARLPQAAAACLFVWLGMTADALAGPPEVDIAETPLYGTDSNLHPNMLLSLSVEYPTVGIAYRSSDGAYDRTSEYIGYFNPGKCYAYNGGDYNVTNGYFSISTDADSTTHECDGKTFSGNFMNWAASSAIDMLRYALTGGDRFFDTESQTILQRAVLPDDFYADDTFFPRRTLTAGGKSSAPNKVTPFEVETLYVVSCRNRIRFSDDKKKSKNDCDTAVDPEKGKPASGDRLLGEFLARVQVCDAKEGAKRTDLCEAYGSHYKPVGAMQRNANKIHFAAMGYLLDDSAARYGGVLRAAAKYVGPSKFEQPGFIESVNENAEWDATTGIFLTDPDLATTDGETRYSGVINYLNMFGRDGVYKSYDPISELYYEGLRYLQGKQPTLDATSGMPSSKMREYFPVIKNWTDPIAASCQKNYIVMIADANTHWDRYVPGNTRTKLNDGWDGRDSARAAEPATDTTPALDVTTWTARVGEMEVDADGAYGNPSPRSNLTNLDTADTGADEHGTYYVSGLAYWANTNDIRLDKPVRISTYVIDVDENGNGEIDDTTRELKPRDSQLYLAAKYGGFDDKNKDGNPFVTSDGDKSPTTIKSNKEWDADGDGVSDNYFLAGQPRTLIKAIRKIFEKIANGSGTTSGVAASSTKVLTSDEYVFQPGFDSSSWSGSLKRLKVTYSSEGGITVATEEDWDAGTVLTGATSPTVLAPRPTVRNIYTARDDVNDTFSTVAFTWDTLSAAQQALLNTAPDTGAADGQGEDRVAYLRGERSKEEGANKGVFRARSKILGDIVHSNPVYVAAPSLQTRGVGYDDFYTAYKNREKVVYVGANDGMLHAFKASDGEEVFAYVPSMLMSRLNRLTAPDYEHQAYVDGTMTTADVLVGSEWKTVLVSGFGGGAQGVFALDITNPDAFGKSRGALWEFSDSDDPDIGNVVGTPVIARFRTGTSKGVPQYRSFAVVGNGLNSYRKDGTGTYNADAPAALFLLALDKAPSAAWKKNVNYYKFLLPISDSSLQNGLSPPVFAVGGDGAVRYGYAGDLQGNLWRFDFTGDAPWSSALGESPTTPLFVAKDVGEKKLRQPITMQPKVVFGPGGYVVLLGTGKFIEDADAAPGSYEQQSFYAVLDPLTDEDVPISRADLEVRTVEGSTSDASLTIKGKSFEYGTKSPGKRGWYLDFLDADKTGERAVTDPLVAYGHVFFNSLIPGTSTCDVGSGRSYALDALTGLPDEGTTTGNLSTIGYLSTPVLFDGGAAAPGDRNALGQRSVTRQYTVFNFGTGDANKRTVDDGNRATVMRPAGRFSWREILNWKELRDAITK